MSNGQFHIIEVRERRDGIKYDICVKNSTAGHSTFHIHVIAHIVEIPGIPGWMQ